MSNTPNASDAMRELVDACIEDALNNAIRNEDGWIVLSDHERSELRCRDRLLMAIAILETRCPPNTAYVQPHDASPSPPELP